MDIPDQHNVRDYVLHLSEKASINSRVFPVDREFLTHNLGEILSYDPDEFIYYNLDLLDALYVNQLFVCLPELWENIVVDDLIKISENFTHVYPYYTLIKFTHKYVEINIIELILNSNRIRKEISYHEQITNYLKTQWNVLVKSDSDFDDFEDGFIDVKYEDWLYIKQKFLIDKRVKPAITDLREMEVYINKLMKKQLHE